MCYKCLANLSDYLVMSPIKSKVINSEGSNGLSNYSDCKPSLKELERKYRILETEKTKKNSVKLHLLTLNKENKHVSENLTRMKKEYEILKSDLQKTLFFSKVKSDKEQIHARKKLDEFLGKRKNLEQQYRKSPMVCELEELVNTNSELSKKFKKIKVLLELTKEQYNDINIELEQNFRRKVCEFCEVILKCKS